MLPEEGLSRSLELLAPARDADTGIAAVDHGADAIYIGASHFGARKQAGNSLQELSRLIAYAHRFKARVYVTLNTLLYDNELEAAHKLIWELYQLGADALIVQDMGILQMDLPPLPLHASTQTNNRSLEKVQFLEQAGFQQVVLARELNLQQIAHISQNTRIPLEFFIHGALCVSYSGQCYMSHHLNGRSANRGECSQPCRFAYDLQTEDGKTLVRDQHLLSLKDLNLSHQLRQLVDAGISSFKIEGRLKDPGYVKNITAHYRRLLDDLIEQDARLRRSSSGRVQTAFTPEPQKSFSRGFTTYFVEGRQKSIWSPHTPKSLGEKIGRVRKVQSHHFELENGNLLNNGDGLCFFNRKQKLVGLRASRVEGQKVYGDRLQELYAGAVIYRNQNNDFEKQVDKSRETRKIAIRLLLKQQGSTFSLQLTDEDGLQSEVQQDFAAEAAEKAEKSLQQIQQQLAKWGGTPFALESLVCDWQEVPFLPAGFLNQLRRQAGEKHLQLRDASYEPPRFVLQRSTHPYPENCSDYHSNITNQLARDFYRQHGCETPAPGFELEAPNGPKKVMTTKHCIRHATDQCPKDNPGASAAPLLLKSGKNNYRLIFDCKNCEMQVFTKD